MFYLCENCEQQFLKGDEVYFSSPSTPSSRLSEFVSETNNWRNSNIGHTQRIDRCFKHLGARGFLGSKASHGWSATSRQSMNM